MHMDEILNGMSEMALERLREALMEADSLSEACAGNARWKGDAENATAWDEASSKVWLMHSIVEDALLAQQAKNK